VQAPAPDVGDESEARTVEVPALRAVAHGAGRRGGVDAWFAPGAEEPPLTELPPNLAPPPAEDPSDATREFVFWTILSTVAFGLVAAVLFRYLGWY
jgi:hypothetical protein